MNLYKIFLLSLVLILSFGCGKSNPVDSQSVSNPSSFTPVTSGPNVLTLQFGGTGICGKYGTVNQPCTSVTLCVPGTTTCQVISDILVDTGSTGLRVFASAVTLSLPAVTDASSNPLAECAQFGTGTDWGPLVKASVVLASETAVTTSIQLINKSFATPSTACAHADTTPATTGFNGILGVGLFKHDCGTYCSGYAANQMYFSCSGTTCTSATVALTSQVQNPVSLLTTDNNGVIVELPEIASTGSSSVIGGLILGIGTQSNNQPLAEVAYSATTQGNFTTVFNGQTYTRSFIDSGSNGLFFPATADTTVCGASSTAPGFYCPASTVSYSATDDAASGSANVVVNFQVGNASTLISSGNIVFNDLGGAYSTLFDWGLPFFLGRRVFVGIETTSSSFGVGPYWAF